MSNEVEWDGEALVGWVSIGGAATKVRVDRETIHCHAAGFNDAVNWEIERHRVEILEKLTPYLIKGLSAAIPDNVSSRATTNSEMD